MRRSDLTLPPQVGTNAPAQRVQAPRDLDALLGRPVGDARGRPLLGDRGGAAVERQDAGAERPAPGVEQVEPVAVARDAGRTSVNNVLPAMIAAIEERGSETRLSADAVTGPLFAETPPAQGTDLQVTYPFRDRTYYFVRYQTADGDSTRAVVSVARRNRFNLPHAEVLQRWTDAGATLHVTGAEGAIWFRSDGEDVYPISWR